MFPFLILPNWRMEMPVDRAHETEIRALADAELDDVVGGNKVVEFLLTYLGTKVADEAFDGCGFVCQYNKVRAANGQKPI
jgi:hypothetical protein